MTDMSYNILILESYKISDYLRCDIAVRSKDYTDEDAYLRGIIECLEEITEYPMEYLDEWNILDEHDWKEFGKKVEDLVQRVRQVYAVPLAERGPEHFP